MTVTLKAPCPSRLGGLGQGVIASLSACPKYPRRRLHLSPRDPRLA